MFATTQLFDLSNILMPLMTTVLTAVTAAIGAVAVKLINYWSAYLISKIGSQNYSAAKEFAKGIFIQLEQKYSGQSGMGERKLAEMTSLLKNKFPQLTDDELTAINKDVWNTLKTVGTAADTVMTDDEAKAHLASYDTTTITTSKLKSDTVVTTTVTSDDAETKG